MHDTRRQALLAIAGLILAGCAGIPHDAFEPPRLSLSSFRMLPSDGLAPRFLIGLQVVNPNRTALNVGALSYEVALEGHRLLSGVAGDLARIPAHAESEIEIQAVLDPASDLSLFNELLNEAQRDRFRFDLRARLDLGALHPPLTLEESGDLHLTPAARR